MLVRLRRGYGNLVTSGAQLVLIVIGLQTESALGMAVCVALMFVLVGFVLIFIVGLGALVLTIMAAVKVSNGDFEYRYPFTLRLLK